MLSTVNLTKKFGNLEVVKGVSLEVSLRETLTLLGPSGSGKTTILRLIAGFEKPDRGTVSIDGIEVSSPERMIEPSKRKLSMIFQDLALWPHMTVKENVKFAMKKNGLNKIDMNEELEKILENINLSQFYNRYPHELSGGEKQRLAIARALASKPVYLLMDEPFSNLDTLLKEELQEVVRELLENSNMGILYVTHNIDEGLGMADRLTIINQGRLEQTGRKDEVFSNPKNEFVKRFLRIK